MKHFFRITLSSERLYACLRQSIYKPKPKLNFTSAKLNFKTGIYSLICRNFCATFW